MRMSQDAVKKLTEPWEGCALHVYDDKVGMGEWQGGPVRGTLTIGIGHTDAAGPPKIHQGMRITQEQAVEIFQNDIRPCENRVNSLLKRTITQHQFDMLVDLEFNCPSCVNAVMPYVNRGDWASVHRIMLMYVNSRGEYMPGLTHRRTAEISWGVTHDDPEVAAANTISARAEVSPPPKTLAQSKTAAAAVTTASVGAGSVVAGIQAANDAADVVKTASHHLNEARDTLADAGFFDHAVRFVHSPTALIVGGCIVVALALFILADRRWKLINLHV